MKRRERVEGLRAALIALLGNHAFAALLAMIAAVGWLHSNFSDLNARQSDSTAEAVQLRADLRALRIELSNCGRRNE